MAEPQDHRIGEAEAPTPPPGHVRERGLHPAVQVGWVVGRVVNAFVLGTLATFAASSLAQWLAWSPVLLGFLVFVGALLLGLWHARLLYASWRWALRDDDVFARYGVVWRVTRSIPRVRVQHVDVTSGPIDRALGLVHVSLHVAGSAGAVLSRICRGAEKVPEHARAAAAVPAADREEELASAGIRPLYRENMPEHLSDLPDAPDVLFVRGSVPPQKGVAVVGTRRASAYGLRLAEQFGVRFYLHGDVIPEEKVAFKIPELDIQEKPLFRLRGVQPFHDFVLTQLHSSQNGLLFWLCANR